MRTLIVFALVGFGAQLVDGALGMAYGVTSTSLLLLLGTNPAAATAPVHAALPVVSVTYTPIATVSIHVPMFETNAPVQKRAKSRWRSTWIERGRRDRMATMWRSCWPDATARRQMSRGRFVIRHRDG